MAGADYPVRVVDTGTADDLGPWRWQVVWANDGRGSEGQSEATP
jgi:hypothetical protein